MRRQLRQLHRNNSGAISVLVLLTMWCLVSLIAMLWNTAEYAVRRQHLQNAADSLAYGPSVWRARTMNQVSVQNMLIAQTASADIVYRATAPTETDITNELNRELRLLDQLEAQQRQLRSRLPGLMANIDAQYKLLGDALVLLQTDINSFTFPDKKTAIIYKNKVRQAGYAADTIQNGYVSRLDGLAQQALNVQITDQMLEEARQHIGDPLVRDPASEFGILQAFINQNDALPLDTSEQLQQHEQQLFQDEQALATTLSDTLTAQQQQTTSFYNVAPSGGNTPLIQGVASVMEAAEVDPSLGIAHFDSIRENYPEMGRSPIVSIDPINPNCKEAGDSDIVHPGIGVELPTGPYHVGMNTQYGWGHCWSFPIERYLSTRLSSDLVGLQNSFMVPIDGVRQDLALVWAKELNLLLNVPAMPASIPDNQPDPITNASVSIPVLPDLTPPTTATGGKTNANFAYRRTAAAYLAAIRRLESVLRNYAGLYNVFTVPYAVQDWHRNINIQHHEVTEELGSNKGFMVLPSYQLAYVPAWAREGMRESLVNAIFWEVYQRTPAIWVLGVQGAFDQVMPACEEIAEEMLSRPWPYEKAPPQLPVPPTRGVTRDERQKHFSIASFVISSDTSAPKFLLPKVFGQPAPFVTYGQSEVFNWMEYNDAYGGAYTEKFDEVSRNTFASLLACPRAWRLSTPGGWNWRARMCPADMVGILSGQESMVTGYFQEGGYSNVEEEPLSVINLH